MEGIVKGIVESADIRLNFKAAGTAGVSPSDAGLLRLIEVRGKFEVVDYYGIC